MTISYQLIKKNMFSFSMSGDDVYFDYFVKNDLVEARVAYEAFLTSRGYDIQRIRLLTAVIFLNMSPMHHDPFDHLLFFMGKSLLANAVEDHLSQASSAETSVAA